MMTIEKETRQLSFEDIKEKLPNKYTMILDNLTEPMTARELAHKLYRLKLIQECSRQETAPRLTELERLGKVKAIEKKKCEYTGKKVSIYTKIEN